MLYVLWTVGCALLFAVALFKVEGLILGGFIGWLVAMVMALRARLHQQEQRMRVLEQAVARSSVSESPTPAVDSAPSPAEEPSPEEEPQPTVAVNFRVVSETKMVAVPEQSLRLDEKIADEPKSEPVQNTAIGSTADRNTVARDEYPSRPPLTGWVASVWNWIQAYFTGGNLMVRVGILILFFGVAFLLKYAASQVVVPVEWRYLGVTLGATLLLVIGWYLRHRNRQYALVAQGGAVGILYLVVFAAYQLHHLMNPAAAFALLVTIVLLSAVIAVLQNAVWLAAVGVTGGFLAPVLVSSGSGDHQALFTYYLILNLGITLIALYRSWRLLNWLGFVFTFGIGSAWGVRYYEPQLFVSTELFLIAFLVLYIVLPMLYAFRQPPRLKGLVDGSLVFGTPVAFMGLQSKLAPGALAWPHLMPASSAILGAMYLMLAFLVWRRARFRLLSESYLAMAVAFLSLAVPLAFDGRVTAAVWALEGVALLWVGLRQARLLPRLSGYGLMLVAAVFYLREPSLWPAPVLWNADYLGALLLSLSAASGAWLCQRYGEKLTAWERILAPKLLLIFAFCWWFGGGIHEIQRQFMGIVAMAWLEGLVLVTGIVCWWIARRFTSLIAVGLGLVVVTVGLVELVLDYNLKQSLMFGWNLNTLSGTLLLLLCLGMACVADPRHFPVMRGRIGSLQRLMRPALLWLSVALALGQTLLQTQYFLSAGLAANVFVLMSVTLLCGLIPLHQKILWAGLLQPVLLILPVIACTLLNFVHRDQDLWREFGWLVLPVSLLMLYWSLRYLARVSTYPVGLFHLATLLMLTLTLQWQVARLFGFTTSRPVTAWIIASWGICLIMVMLLSEWLKTRRWPFTAYPLELGLWWPRALSVMLALWLMLANIREPGVFSGLLSLPLLNPIDLVCLVAVLMLFRYWNLIDAGFLTNLMRSTPANLALPAALAFVVLNGAVLRGCHLLLELPYQLRPLLQSFVVESALSVLWSLTALLTMLIATRRCWRQAWMVGAALMAVVVLKLFVVDMSGTGTIARIVAFITVGVLLLVMGYFAPIPPRQTETFAQDKSGEEGDKEALTS